MDLERELDNNAPIERQPYEVPAECDPRCILVSKLHRQTIAHTLYDYFMRHGPVERVELELDEERRSKGRAIILFE